MHNNKDNLKIGTCSWNYDSWINLVYTKTQSYAAQYLKEYALKYRTVEIDSWFYKIPTKQDVQDYLLQVDNDFTFSCKLTESITLTHHRTYGKKDTKLVVNDDFLSIALFNKYIQSLLPMLNQINAIELEFEYLNKDKMQSLDMFLKKLDTFISSIELSIPLAIETRNKNYLTDEYFSFLKEKNIAHVFSQMVYLPNVYEIYEQFHDKLSNLCIIRLMGGNRKDIEQKTGNKWDSLVEEKENLPLIVTMIKHMVDNNKKVCVYVNNHFEGCAPKTIEKINNLLS